MQLLIFVLIIGVLSFGLVGVMDAEATLQISDDPTGGECTTIGTWNSISKTCTVTSNIIDEPEGGIADGFVIEDNGITIDGDGFSITQISNSLGQSGGAGVFISGKTDVTIQNLQVDGLFSDCISIHSTQTIVSSSIDILNNVLLCERGIFLDNVDNISIIGNEIINRSTNSDAIIVSGSDDNQITDNQISTGRFGIQIGNSFGNLITDNEFHSTSEAGAVFYSGSGNNIFSNNILDSNLVDAISLRSGTHDNMITENMISNNAIGITIEQSSTIDNQIFNNHFVSNPIQARILDGSTSNNFFLPSPIGGNHWDNFDESSEGCFDIDNDTFCDDPFVFSGGQDDLPHATREVNVFNDDFEGTFDWSDIQNGVVTKTNVGTDAVSGENVARKTTNNDPNGAIKQLDNTVDDFEIMIYSKRLSVEAAGSVNRYSIVQSTEGNGYGFYISGSLLVIEKRDNFVSKQLVSTSDSWDLGQWNTLRFIKIGNDLTLEYYKNQIVDPAVIEQTIPTNSLTTSDHSYSGGFNYAAINGGQDFDTDDFMVWSIGDLPTPTLTLQGLQQQINDIISGVTMIAVDWFDITNRPAGLDDGDDDTLAGLGCTTNQIAQYDGSQWACAPDPGEPIEIMRIDGGRITDINPVEIYFLDGDGVTRNIPLEFELASKMVGVDGTISEVQYKIGKSNTAGESVTARIYKNNVEIGSCNLVTSTTSHSSCTMTLSESVVKSDLLAMTDIVNGDSSISVEGKSAFIAITTS